MQEEAHMKGVAELSDVELRRARKLNKVFRGKLETIIQDINGAVAV